MTVTVTVANSVPAGSLGAAFSSFSASGLFTLTGVEDNLTAFATGGQTNALALSSTKNFHRISVCATEGDSVKLPPATVGQSHFIRNDGAAGAQVFGTTPDTINGVATATGVPLGIGSGVWFVCTTAAKWTTAAGDELDGKWQVNASGALVPNAHNTYDIGNGASDPRDLNLARHAYVGGLLVLSGVEDTLTAHAGGTKAAALALSATKNFHRVSVCATEGDSVLLPAATVGQSHFVRHDGAAPMKVYGAGTDTIDGIATATGVQQAAGTGALYECLTAGEWRTTGLVQAGTWLPSVGGTATYTSQAGWWRLNGKQLTVNGSLQINALGTGSIYSVTNLPYASANNGVTNYGVVGSFATFNSSNVMLTPYNDPNTANLSFLGMAAAGVVNGLVSPYKDAAAVSFQIEYPIA